MAGRRLLDAALVLTASRNIAKQHFKIRAEQFELWSQTSSVAKAIKNQTDRVTLTAAAASALAQRFNEESPTQYYTKTQKTSSAVPSQSQEVTSSPRTGQVGLEGLKQDHHYNQSDQNSAQEPAPSQDIGVRQEDPSRFPTPDGSIPPAGAPIDTINTPEPDLGVTGTRTEAPRKEPLAQDQDHHADQGFKPAASRDSTIPDPNLKYASNIPEHDVVPQQDSMPQGINTDIFHSAKVSAMMGGNVRNSKFAEELRLRKARTAPPAQSRQAQEMDQDTFSMRTSGTAKPSSQPTEKGNASDIDVQELGASIAQEAEALGNEQIPANQQASGKPAHHMRESRVPSSRFGRLWEYGGLATSMAFGAVGESFRRATGSSSAGSLLLSAGNMERLVAKLSRMRGAALKLGQMMSFQDSKMLPAPIHEVLQRVQDNADYMPPAQRDQVLSSNLGEEWRSLFSEFSDVPMAAASIGQVHRAVLATSGKAVAVKIQYPGVATSISSDLNNLSVLLTASRLLPKGLFLDKTIANARTELAWECDYEREASCQKRFRELLRDDSDTFTVPAVVEEACGPQVLTAEFMSGTAVTKSSLQLSQTERDWIGTKILKLALRELTEFKFMQTDPNWTNFLYNRGSQKLELLDFGAARDFPDKFVDPYIQILLAAAEDDRETIKELSVVLGYLTGRESNAMVNAHVDSVLTLAEPFKVTNSASEIYDFRDQTITDRVRSFIPVMIKERLAPPPEETYSLHRKLSGAFLLLARLGSRVKCRELFVEATKDWAKGSSA